MHIGETGSNLASQYISPSCLRLVAGAVMLAILALAAAQAAWRDAQPLAHDRAGTTASAGAAAGEPEYFPARYVNQATEGSEHIQAF